MYLVYKAIELEDLARPDNPDGYSSLDPHGVVSKVRQFLTQYRQLFQERRLRNALVSSSTVALVQQLCGSTSIPFASSTI